MSDPRSVMSPQDSLLNYFDELLIATDESLTSSVTPTRAFDKAVADMPVAQSAVIQVSATTSVSQLAVAEVAIPNAARPFAEPEALAFDHKEKLERLLASARLQRQAEEAASQSALLVVAVAPAKTEPVIKAEPVIKTGSVIAEIVKPVPIKPRSSTQPLPQVSLASVATRQAPHHSQSTQQLTQPSVVTSTAERVAVPAQLNDSSDEFNDKSTLDELAWAANGRPLWAQQRFEVLLFDVAGLTLAVPLKSLGQIQLITDQLTPLFGQADWFMGLLPTPMGKIRTVNTAKFVMPERYDDSFLDSAKYVVSINGLPWGLAVDNVNQPISLSPDDVKWRGERSKRAWLAGTVKEHMCALIDIPMMGKMLQDLDANVRRL